MNCFRISMTIPANHLKIPRASSSVAIRSRISLLAESLFMRYYVTKDPITGNHSLYTVQTEAKAADPDFETIEVPVDKAGLGDFVQGLLDQIDNLTAINDAVKASGLEVVAITTDDTQSAPDTSHSPSEAKLDTMTFDDMFEDMPLARQLHFASLATEYARSAIKETG